MRAALNAQDHNGNTPLHIAAYFGNYAAVRHFLALGADPSLRDKTHCNPLDLAKDKFVRNVLSNLNEAAFECDLHNLKNLVNCGNKIDEKLSIFGEAPIHKAVLTRKETNMETVSAVLDCGASIENMDCNGWTPLHHAAYKGDLPTANLLLNRGANPNSFSNSKKTPVHFAALNNHNDVLKLLLEKGGDRECLTEESCTPLHMAARKGNLECVRSLLIQQANVYAQDFRQWTALHYAAYNGHRKVVNLLVTWDADREKLRGMLNTQGKKA